MTTRRLPIHRAAVVVFADVPGVDAHDAANRLAATLANQLDARCISAPRRPGSPVQPANIHVLDVVDLTTSARNGYLVIRPAARLPHE
jgi:hypothetical protein